MNAHQIRNILNDEVTTLRAAGNRRASFALNEFAGEATDAELIRFRELITGLPDLKLPHATNQ